ncbi:hypothetical protein [Ectothiorhodospira shaposhnikovii]|uniref:hypothetical protein n=1 Tax=Ectothiorhodospira shaposhnikovii TaxID=1054 RepID=UPI001EE8115C|nr:hypothetical protein [Ectothiorhodospira shaposhnikovii]MCG5513954.1 hypothetical protein [Ectothiorhodospira shaposhnikovii]
MFFSYSGSRVPAWRPTHGLMMVIRAGFYPECGACGASSRFEKSHYLYVFCLSLFDLSLYLNTLWGSAAKSPPFRSGLRQAPLSGKMQADNAVVNAYSMWYS